MIYQIGDDLPFRFAYIASKLGMTGLTVTIKAAYRNDVALGALAGVAIPAVGNGLYSYTMDGATYNTVAGTYIVIATTADATVDQRDLFAICVVTPWVADIDEPISDPKTLTAAYDDAKTAAQAGDAMALTAGALSDVDTELSGTHGAGSWEGGGGAPTVEEIRAEMDDNSTQLAAIRAKTDAIGTGSAFIAAPVLPSGNVNMVVGDVYKAADGRSFDWTYPTWNIAIGSVVVVIIQNIVVFTATRISATAVRLELTSVQSSTVKPGRHTFYIREIQADAEPISILTGTWVASAEPAPMP